MATRMRIPKEAETLVLTECLRRCCVCYFVDGINTPKRGQIAHINKKRDDHRYENLVFLCFDHHDAYDSVTSQSKNLTSGEISHYKQQLINSLRPYTGHQKADNSCGPFDDIEEYINQPWKHGEPWPQVPVLFPYKSPNRHDGVCRIEKINLRDGRIAIICEEVEGNPGMSITNAVEFIATQVCREYEIDPQQLIWIEHYDVNLFGTDEWNTVEFGRWTDDKIFEDPSWKSMTPIDWESLGLKLSSEPLTRIRQSNSRISKLFE